MFFLQSERFGYPSLFHVNTQECGGQALPEVPDVETSVGAAGSQDRLIVRRPLYLMNQTVGH